MPQIKVANPTPIHYISPSPPTFAHDITDLWEV